MFCEKILRIGGVENLRSFESAIYIFLLHLYSNQSQFMEYQGWLPWFQNRERGYRIMKNTVSLKRCISRSNLLSILQAFILQTLVDISHNPLKYFTEQVSYSKINHEAPNNSIMPHFFCLPIESCALLGRR